MKEIKFTTHYEETLSIADPNFKIKYQEKIGRNSNYIQDIDGEKKHLAVCPHCNNPVVILGVFKKIKNAPHARHAKNINIPNIAQYNEYKYLHCPYHRKHANYVREYVPETEEPQRQELYRIAQKHFDKAIYMLEQGTGIHITKQMAKELAQNYAEMRVYNYIDATIYNIPWYLIYGHCGFPLYHMIVKKNTKLHKQLMQLGLTLRDSNIKDCVYVEDNRGYVLMATDYRYSVNDDILNEQLNFSIVQPDDNITDVFLCAPVHRFSIKLEPYHFGNLVNYEQWKSRQDLLDIAAEYMNPDNK